MRLRSAVAQPTRVWRRCASTPSFAPTCACYKVGLALTDARRLITDMFWSASSASYEADALARFLPIVVAWCSEAEQG